MATKFNPSDVSDARRDEDVDYGAQADVVMYLTLLTLGTLAVCQICQDNENAMSVLSSQYPDLARVIQRRSCQRSDSSRPPKWKE